MGDVSNLAECGPRGRYLGLLAELRGQKLAGDRVVVVFGQAALPRSDHQPAPFVNVLIERSPFGLVELLDVEHEDAGVRFQVASLLSESGREDRFDEVAACGAWRLRIKGRRDELGLVRAVRDQKHLERRLKLEDEEPLVVALDGSGEPLSFTLPG